MLIIDTLYVAVFNRNWSISYPSMSPVATCCSAELLLRAGIIHACSIDDASDIHAYTKHASPALNTSSTIWCIELDDNMTELYPRLP